MQATKLLKGNWQLDLVGGYGKKKDEVIKWAEKQQMSIISEVGDRGCGLKHEGV